MIEYRNKFLAMNRLVQFKIVSALVLASIIVLVTVPPLFTETTINGETFSTAVLVGLFLLVCYTGTAEDYAYMFSYVVWLGLIITVTFAVGAATTSLLMSGQTTAAVGAGVAFGALVMYVISEYASAVFGFVEELVKLIETNASRLAKWLVATGTRYIKARFQIQEQMK